jgi:energy-coupling factor transporter transmembrane protein EcfT
VTPTATPVTVGGVALGVILLIAAVIFSPPIGAAIALVVFVMAGVSLWRGGQRGWAAACFAGATVALLVLLLFAAGAGTSNQPAKHVHITEER